MNNTINYYNQNAENFIANTQNADMHPTQERFLCLLEANTSILDFGYTMFRFLPFTNSGVRWSITEEDI